jgi:hypothetical protein
MKLISSFLLVMGVVLFAACSSGGSGKKVIVMSSGKMNVDTKDPKVINFEPGTQHNELEIMIGSGDKAITVKSAAGDKTYDVPDDGLYLLNLKVDTLIGSLVNYGAQGVPASITGDQLQHIIDSTKLLLAGQNVSDEKKTYFILPGTVKKITTNLNAQFLSPFKGIPYKVEVDKDGNAPEMYKFSTVKQKRESLEELLQRMAK